MAISLSSLSRFQSPYDVLGYQLRLLSQIWHRQLNAGLAAIDLTEMQFVLLMGLEWLSENGNGDVLLRNLAESCGCSTALASQVLQKLVGKRLVIVTVDARDARARNIRLSDAGEQRIKAAVSILERTDKAFRQDDPVVAERLFDALQAAIEVKLANTSQPGPQLGAMPLLGTRHQTALASDARPASNRPATPPKAVS